MTAEQARWVDEPIELAVQLGLPDRRLGTILPRIRQLAETYADQLTAPERRHLTALADESSPTDGRLRRLRHPQGHLVHGDFHPGNVRGTPGHYVILDWGDSAVGHPSTDEPRVHPAARPGRPGRASAAREAWRALQPAATPIGRVELLAPVTALIAATQYADFVAAIEPDEHVYHAADVPEMLRQACAASHQVQHLVP